MTRHASSFALPARPRLVGALVFVVVVAMLGTGSAHAQTAAAPDWNLADDALQGGIGLHYGKLGGEGLAFRTPLRWWLYFQVAGGVWHTGDTKKHNLGFNLNYVLRQDQRLRIFINAGAGFFYSKKKTGTSGGQDVYDLDEDWNLGAGVGIEYLQGRRWAWKVEADFAHLGKNGDIKVVPQAGLTYYW